MTTVLAERVLTQADFDAFAALSGDFNPIHTSPAFAAQSAFARTVAHGVMLTSLLRALAAPLFEGRAVCAQEAMFPAPTFAEEPLRFCAVRLDDRQWQVWCERSADSTRTCTLTVTLT
jgi:3-hydroxybutyryl-CoA dehydratase